MSLFGPPEEDPLLQNDPFAPDDADTNETSPPEDRNADGAPDTGQSDTGKSDTSRSNTDASDEETSLPFETAESPSSVSPSNREEAGSVFSPSESHSPIDGSEETRLIVRSAEEAANGQLDRINAAFAEGWFLDRVELREDSREDSLPEEVSPSPGRPFALAFVLRRPGTK